MGEAVQPQGLTTELICAVVSGFVCGVDPEVVPTEPGPSKICKSQFLPRFRRPTVKEGTPNSFGVPQRNRQDTLHVERDRKEPDPFEGRFDLRLTPTLGVDKPRSGEPKEAPNTWIVGDEAKTGSTEPFLRGRCAMKDLRLGRIRTESAMGLKVLLHLTVSHETFQYRGVSGPIVDIGNMMNRV